MIRELQSTHSINATSVIKPTWLGLAPAWVNGVTRRRMACDETFGFHRDTHLDPTVAACATLGLKAEYLINTYVQLSVQFPGGWEGLEQNGLWLGGWGRKHIVSPLARHRPIPQLHILPISHPIQLTAFWSSAVIPTSMHRSAGPMPTP